MQNQNTTKKEEKFEFASQISAPWKKEEFSKECADCATSCQSACKTSCTVGNVPCEKRR